MDSKPYIGGIHFLGVGHSFIKYPKTVQTIEFSQDRTANGPSINSRTNDGLEVILEISFQYKLNLYIYFIKNFLQKIELFWKICTNFISLIKIITSGFMKKLRLIF